METLSFTPIGFYHSALKHRYETPRQGVLAPDNTGIVELESRRNFEQALRDLETFERIWIVFVFHLNRNWKPLVSVPRHRADKVGVFATRAPFRPNPIGMSCVRLLRIDGLNVHVGETDLLDGSPILDIKPYLPYADSFPAAATGWVADALADACNIEIDAEAGAHMDWIREKTGINLRGYIDVQLTHDPTNRARKRISPAQPSFPGSTSGFMLAYRTWRILYSVDGAGKTVRVTGIRSGYTAQDLIEDRDPYEDKRLHREFLAAFRLPAIARD